MSVLMLEEVLDEELEIRSLIRTWRRRTFVSPLSILHAGFFVVAVILDRLNDPFLRDEFF